MNCTQDLKNTGLGAMHQHPQPFPIVNPKLFFSLKFPIHTSAFPLSIPLKKMPVKKITHLGRFSEGQKLYICRGLIPIIVWFYPSALRGFHPITLFSVNVLTCTRNWGHLGTCYFSYSPHIYNLTNTCISSPFFLCSLREGGAALWSLKCSYYVFRCSPAFPYKFYVIGLLIVLPIPSVSGCWTTLGKVLFFSWAHLGLKSDWWYILKWQEFCRKCKVNGSLA